MVHIKYSKKQKQKQKQKQTGNETNGKDLPELLNWKKILQRMEHMQAQ